MASEAIKLRIVRCPKCRKLLTEFSDVPVYECGGCGAVLKAKHHQANNGVGASHMLGSISSEKNLLQHVSEAGGSSNNVSTLLNREVALFSTDSNDMDINHVGEHKRTAVPSEKASSSDYKHSCHEEEESSECAENADMEASLTNDNTMSTGQSGVVGKETNFGASDQQGRSIQINMDSCSDEPLDDSWKFSERESVNSCSSCKIDPTESSLSSEGDIVEADPGNTSCEKMNVPTARNARACSDNDPSYNGISNSNEQYLFSSSAVSEEISDSGNAKETDAKKDILLENMDAAKPQLQSRNLSLKSSDERHASSAIFGSSDLNRRSSSNHVYRRENSQQSEIFYSARKELEDDLETMSLSRDSSFQKSPWNGKDNSPTRLRNLENDRMELLRKVDELRDHLTKPYAAGRGGNRRFYIQDIRQERHRPLLCNPMSEQVLMCCNSNITQRHSGFFAQRAIAKPYQYLQVPFSGQGNSPCLHHHPQDRHIPLQLPHNSYCRACTHHVFCNPSSLSRPSWCKDCNIALCSHKGQTCDQHYEKLHCKEKKEALKHRCRPVSGGAPFVICNSCMQLLQLPADFLVSRARYHKLKCGGCSEVLIFLSNGGHVVPHSGTQLDPVSSEVDNAVEPVRKCELSTNRSYGCLQGDPVSYSEEYGPPFSNGYSTDEPLPHILKSPLGQDRRRGKQAVSPALHRLMGYDSATELIYQPSDEDEAYESTDMAPFYGTCNEIHFDEVHGGNGMGYPLQASEIGRSPEHRETHEGDRSIRQSTNLGGGSPLRGLFKKGIKELNHGLESMKLKRHTGRRVIPAP